MFWLKLLVLSMFRNFIVLVFGCLMWKLKLLVMIIVFVVIVRFCMSIENLLKNSVVVNLFFFDGGGL